MRRRSAAPKNMRIAQAVKGNSGIIHAICSNSNHPIASEFMRVAAAPVPRSSSNRLQRDRPAWVYLLDHHRIVAASSGSTVAMV